MNVRARLRLRRAFSNTAGLTLIELLVVMAMTAILAVALSFAFSMELTMQRMQEARRAKGNATETMERAITRMLTGARLDTGSATGLTTTYLQGLSDGGAAAVGSDRITFTTTEPGVSMAAINSQDDFQTQQTARGPVGGLAEVSIGMTPVGTQAGRRDCSSGSSSRAIPIRRREAWSPISTRTWRASASNSGTAHSGKTPGTRRR